MWVFRWLIIWCERSLCFHWKDTGGAGTCFSKKRCRKLSLSSYPECRQLEMTEFVFLLVEPNFYSVGFFFFVFSFLVMACQIIFFPILLLSSAIWYGWFTTVITLIMVIRVSGGKQKVSAALTLIQMFFSSSGPGKLHTHINSADLKNYTILKLVLDSCWCSGTIYCWQQLSFPVCVWYLCRGETNFYHHWINRIYKHLSRGF